MLFKTVPVGAVAANANNGLAAAKTITITAGADSNISADGVADQVINLNANSSSQTTPGSTTFTLSASTVETLNLGGPTPIVVIATPGHISEETVTSTNADATIQFNATATMDASAVQADIKLNVNEDLNGKTITIGEGQTYNIHVLDAEGAQTGAGTFKQHKVSTTSISDCLYRIIHFGNTRHPRRNDHGFVRRCDFFN